METTVELTTPTIPLAALLKLAGVSESGGQAKRLVQEGQVRLNRVVETRRSAQVRPGDVVEVSGPSPIRIRVR